MVRTYIVQGCALLLSALALVLMGASFQLGRYWLIPVQVVIVFVNGMIFSHQANLRQNKREN
jgi:general stress protein CsbA